MAQVAQCCSVVLIYQMTLGSLLRGDLFNPATGCGCLLLWLPAAVAPKQAVHTEHQLSAEAVSQTPRCAA